MVNLNVIGRLGADAEKINGKNGQFLSFRLATDDRANGEKITTWFRVTFNGDRSGKLAEYLTKGKLINVIGTETVSLYTAKDGSKQISRDINASSIEFVSIGSGNTQTETTNNGAEKDTISTGSFKKQAPIEVTVKREAEEDLPF